MTTIRPSRALNADLIGSNCSSSADSCHLELSNYSVELKPQLLWVSMNTHNCRFFLVEFVSEYLKTNLNYKIRNCINFFFDLVLIEEKNQRIATTVNRTFYFIRSRRKNSVKRLWKIFICNLSSKNDQYLFDYSFADRVDIYYLPIIIECHNPISGD